MQLSIIIVSFNTKDLLQQTIESIPKKKEREIIVVDNASKDGSCEMVEENYPDVKLIKNKENVGFSQANNQGIKISSGKLILLLNSDTKILNEALDKLARYMQKNPEVGISSCQLLNPDGSIQPQGGYLPRLSNVSFWMLFIDDLPLVGKYLSPYQLRDKSAYTKERLVGWVGGAAMCIRRRVIEAVGFLDERIFMYAEDVEYCLRASKKGFKIGFTPEPKIMHYGQQSSGGAPTNAWLGEFQGIKYIFRNHKPKWEYPILRLFLKLGALLRMIIFGILGGRKEVYEAYKKAFELA